MVQDNVEVRKSMVEDAKARKNAVSPSLGPSLRLGRRLTSGKTELEGFRQANIRDGVALIQYFAWLEEVLSKGEKWTEYDAASVLEKYRQSVESLVPRGEAR